LVDMLKAHCPNSAEAARAKVQHTYGGPLSLGGDSVSVAGMTNCDPNAQLRVAVAKLYPKDDCTAFDALARVMSGTLKLGQTVKVLGEGFSPDDEEDVAVKTVTNLWVYNTRYRIPVQRYVNTNLNPASTFAHTRLTLSFTYPKRDARDVGSC
jgi:U5 small nuclear ribonucleoprotein component